MITIFIPYPLSHVRGDFFNRNGRKDSLKIPFCKPKKYGNTNIHTYWMLYEKPVPPDCADSTYFRRIRNYELFVPPR